MVRIIAFVALAVLAGYVYETYTGDNIGIRKSGHFVKGFFAGGYGMATGVGTSVGGSVAGAAGSAGKIIGGTVGSLGN